MQKNSVLPVFMRLLATAKKYKYAIVLAIFGVIISKASEAAIYKFFLPNLINKGLYAREQEFLTWVPLAVFAIFFSRGCGEFLANYFMGVVGRSTVRDQRLLMLEHLLVLPVAYFKNITSGELVSKINYDAEQVATAVSHAVLEFLNSGIALMFFICIMFSFSWQLSLMVLGAIPVFAIYLHNAGKFMRRYSTRVQQTMGRLTQVSGEIIDGHQVIKTFQGNDYEKQRIQQVSDANCKQELRVFLVTSLSSPVMQLIGAGCLSGFIYLVTQESLGLNTGEVVGFIGALFAAIHPLKQISQVNNVFQRGIAAAESIHELLDQPAESDKGTFVNNNVKGEIRFDKACFGYKPNNLVLKDISFTISPGQTLALVGKSGGGKSTIAQLLPRFYSLDSGSILLDEVNINDYKLDNLRQQFSVVSQSIILFNDTIANNIAYANPSSREKIIDAATAAFVMDFVQDMPDGIDTIIGENGNLLSGGQRQRIAIARAILKQAPLLILDEATSALDSESEHLIQTALQAIMQNCTTIVIAHRLSTIKQADKILVIDDGEIKEIGNHQQLVKSGGYYSRLQSIGLQEVVGGNY